mmetsp:Transcript_45249/g.105573  ORF Transcript_45249/g.105573 Transcript_45249/m.105573 type:complete len:370 (-) Transcript_45249:208-1317(-)
MFKKRERPKATRAKEIEEPEDLSLAAGELAAKRQRRGATATASSATGESGSIAASTRKEPMSEAARIADRQQDAVFSGFKASNSTENTPSSDAVRRLEVDTDVSQDTRAILERNEEINKGLKDGSLEKGVYRGLKAYKQYSNRSEHAIANSKYTGLLGPLRSSLSNVRSTLRIEYIGTSGEGGICKDYKETGYCGFGDSCKFAHDRSDYKPSYILEQEWEAKQKAIEEKRKKRWEKKMERRRKAEEEGRALEDDDEDSSVTSDATDDEEELPTECFECGETWQRCKSIAVQTKCGHYFCEDCAFTAFAKSPKCIRCGANTEGIFNSAETLQDKLKAKKERRAERKRMKNMKRREAQNTFGVNMDGGNLV